MPSDITIPSPGSQQSTATGYGWGENTYIQHSFQKDGTTIGTDFWSYNDVPQATGSYSHTHYSSTAVGGSTLTLQIDYYLDDAENEYVTSGTWETAASSSFPTGSTLTANDEWSAPVTYMEISDNHIETTASDTTSIDYTTSGGAITIDRSESTTVSETLTNGGVPNISSSESTAVTETGTSAKLEWLNINRTETTTVTDTTGTAVFIPFLALYAEQGLSAADALALELTMLISATEAAHLDEIGTGISVLSPPGLAISDAADTTTVSESATAAITLAVAVSDTVGVSDTPTLTITPHISSTDTVNISETATLLIETLFVSVSDTAGAADAASLSIDNIAVSTSDSVTVTEQATLLIPILHLSVSENSSVTEQATVRTQFDISVSDATTVTDTATTVVRAPWFNPDAFVANTGAIVSGGYKDTWYDDGVEFVLSEVTGTTGFDYEFWFNHVTEPGLVNSFDVHGRYDGNPAHNIKLQQWNFTSSQWIDATANANDFPASGTEIEYEIAVSHAADFVSAAQMRFRVVHTSPGNPIHTLVLDQVYLGAHYVVLVSDTTAVTDTATVLEPFLTLSVSESTTATDEASWSVEGSLDLSISVSPDNAYYDVRSIKVVG